MSAVLDGIVMLLYDMVVLLVCSEGLSGTVLDGVIMCIGEIDYVYMNEVMCGS